MIVPRTCSVMKNLGRVEREHFRAAPPIRTSPGSSRRPDRQRHRYFRRPSSPAPRVDHDSIDGGPPCPNGCGSTFQFRDALLFYPLPAEGDEDATREFDPDTWETAFITFHYGGNPGEKNWVFRYRLQSDMSISGTSFEAVWSSESIQPSDLPSPAKEALLAARTSYLGDEAGEPTLEFGILTAVSWGCSFHHYKYIESKVGSLPLIAVTSAEGLLQSGQPHYGIERWQPKPPSNSRARSVRIQLVRTNWSMVSALYPL